MKPMRARWETLLLTTIVLTASVFGWTGSGSATPPQSDADIGCCTLMSEPAVCFTTNRAYCRDRANKARVTFKFHKDTACKDVDACKSSEAAKSANACRQSLPTLEGNRATDEKP